MTSTSLFVFLSLLIICLVYYYLAKRYNIVDKPNHRSSHSKTTVRGGGIIFPIAVLFWWIGFGFEHSWMVLGLACISAVSMLDDIYTISRKIRFLVQFLGLTCAFYDLGVFEHQSFWALPILYFVALGIINAINFMDGINGITGLYALVFFGSLLAVNQYLGIFGVDLITYLILAIFVFLLFNLRKRALMFAGDIGSISIAYLMIYFLVQWYLTVESWTIILFLAIYGADVFVTMVERWRNKENLLEPHRSHLYQLLVNQGKKEHVLIAFVYAVLQLIINFFLFIYPMDVPGGWFSFAFLALLAVIYSLIKKSLKTRFKESFS